LSSAFPLDKDTIIIFILYISSSIDSAFININISNNNIFITRVNSFNINSLISLVNKDFKFISYL
jgi:hypothetical protein